MPSYGLTLVTAPTSEPLTLAEAKRQCGVADDINAFNEQIESLTKAAREKVETDTGRALMSQTWDYTFDLWPCGLEAIYLPMAPVSSITSLKYYDTSNVQQTLATTVYDNSRFLNREPAEIRLKNAQSWPALYGEAGAVTVRFVAGYSSIFNVPESLKQAMKLLLKNWWDNPSATIVGTIQTENGFAYNALIDKWRLGDEFHQYGRSYQYA